MLISYLESISAACVIALKKLVFFGEVSVIVITSVTFVPTQSVYEYETFLASFSSADDVSPTGAANFVSPFSLLSPM